MPKNDLGNNLEEVGDRRARVQDHRKVRVKPQAQQRGAEQAASMMGYGPAAPMWGMKIVHPKRSGWEVPHSHRGCTLILKGDLSLWEA